jgi:hypothetical protein
MANPLYKGIKIIHELDIIPIIKRIIKNFDPEIIIEIGTAHGGLTLVFHEAAPKADIHTYDPFRNITKSSLFGKKVHFHKEDAFKSKNIRNICKSNKRKILFCDGFDKKKEFLTFAPLLNSGDLAGVHDYPSRLWKDWVRGCNIKKIEKIIHPDFKNMINQSFEPIKENEEFEELQKNSGQINAYSDRYWKKIR